MTLDLSQVQRLTYDVLLRGVSSFLSLDISVNSTGWVCKYDNTVKWGIYHLMEKDNRARRKEFAKFLIDLIGERQFDFVVIEDVIAGCNFKTTRSLTELNTIIEDIMDYGKVPQSPVYRKDNKEWKRELKELSQDKVGIKGSDDKETIRFCLRSLGFDPDDSPQDVYDAMGIALAYISNKDNVTNGQGKGKMRKLHEDLAKNYKITQYASQEEMQEAALKKQSRLKVKKEIQAIEYNPDFRNLLVQFKKLVEIEGDDKIFCIHTPLNKIGSMFVTKGFDLSQDDVYFIAVL